MGSRLPNTAPFSFGNDSFKVVQYSGRGIPLRDPYARQLAVNNIQALAKTAHVLCLEEVHGHHLEIKSCFSVWLPGWTVFASSALRVDGSDNYGAGGVAIALCPALAVGAIQPIDHKIHVAGRCNSVTVSIPKPSNLMHSICIINLHNYNFSTSQVSRVGAFLTGRSIICLLYTSPSPRDVEESRMPSSA